MKITIGIPTYNGVNRTKLLLSSIFNYTSSAEQRDLNIVVLDDGTPYLEERKKLENICDRFSVSFIQHEKNLGISASWNSLTRFSPKSDITILFNDDVQICHQAWLGHLKYFFEHNEKIGTVSFPVFYIDPLTALPCDNLQIPDINIPVQMSFSPNGQGFAFRTELFKIASFDERLISFYEECDFGHVLSTSGYYSYSLPFPVIQHFGSQTFSQNLELAYMKPRDYLPMDKYREILSNNFPIEKIEPIPGGYVYRMEYSRVLYALKWNCSDYWDKPQEETEKNFALNYKPRVIRWLNKDRIECEALI